MIMVSIALVMAVVVTNLYLRKDSNKRAAACLRRLFVGNAYPGNTNHVRRLSSTNRVAMNENHVNEIMKCSPGDVELDSLSMLSESERLTCRNSCCTGSRGYTGRGGPARGRGVAAVGGLDTGPDLGRISYEWQVLAKAVDRLFFWLFLLSSIAALTSMFAQLPHFKAT